MAEFAWFRMFPRDMLGDTEHLSNEEFGAYHRLIYAAWLSRDCKLPDDDKKLARIARMSLRKWRASAQALRAYWTPDDRGGLSQKRLDIERNISRAYIAQKVRAGEARGLQIKAAAVAGAGSDDERSLSGGLAIHGHGHNVPSIGPPSEPYVDTPNPPRPTRTRAREAPAAKSNGVAEDGAVHDLDEPIQPRAQGKPHGPRNRFADLPDD